MLSGLKEDSVAGNAVLLKPAEQSMVIAAKWANIAHEAGIPLGAFQLLFGRGEVTGATLVQSPKVSTIAFTGSRLPVNAIVDTLGD